MRLKYIADKFKIILNTTPVFQEQLTEFYNHIPMREISVKFFNPYTGEYKTIQCYRGDRKTSLIYDFDHIGKLYDSVSQSLIEL